jgi:hypothetical protein
MLKALTATGSPIQGKAVLLSVGDKQNRVDDRQAGSYQAEDEDRHIVHLVIQLLFVSVLPATIFLLYLYLYPDSLHYDITPQRSIDTWLPRR